MCGILGISGDIEIRQAQSLLQLLIHRGQDASGLSWLDSYNVHQTSKVKGSPAQIEVPDEIVKSIIGSTRYPTLGNRMGDTSKNKFAQPFSYQTNLGTLSLAHNGNITNLSEICTDPSKFQSDAEFITKRLGELINESNDLRGSVQKLMEILDGAYSIVGMLGQDMFCFRDPRGIRPLVYGYNGKHHIFTSESLVLQQAGITSVSDIIPGSLVYLNSKTNSKENYQLAEAQRPAHCFFEYVYFSSSVSTINQQNVYQARLNLGKNIAVQLLEKNLDKELDYVVPVPDTSKSASETIAEQLAVPLREAIMKNRSSMRTFIMPTEDQREQAARAKYLFVDEYIKGKSLLLVDDSIVRGLTTKYLIKILKDRGARQVHVAVTCPPQRFACYYGVDFGTDDELIARNNRDADEISIEIGANSLTYISIENLRKSIDIPSMCEACITGEYPTPFGQQLRLKIAEGLLSPSSSHYEQG